MSLAKKAQRFGDFDDDLIFSSELDISEDDILSAFDNDSDDNNEDEKEIEVVVKVEDEDDDGLKEFSFELPLVPGGEFQGDLDELFVEDEDEEIEISEPDMWDWQSRGLSNFFDWLVEMTNNVPKHSGFEVSGLERALSFLDELDRCISKAVRSDIKGELDIAKIEKIRDEVHKGRSRLEERRDRIEDNKGGKKKRKNKKSSEQDSELVKEGQKISGVKGVIVTVPLFISHLARVLINGTVSAGHDMEDMFTKLVEKYNLSNREKAELTQLIDDMGFYIRRDRGVMSDDVDISSSDNFDWNANYHA